MSARLKASNLTICDDFYFNRGYNKINCYRNIRTQVGEEEEGERDCLNQ